MFTHAEHEKLRAAAAKEERTASELVRDAVKREIRRLARERRQPGDERRSA